MPRRLMPLILLVTAVAGIAGFGANAQENPLAGKQIRFFTMGSPGGGYDAYMRTVIPGLERRLSAKLIPINESGAGGLTAMLRVMTAPADGQTILLIGGEALVLAQLYKLPGVNYDVRKLEWIARLSADDKVVMTAQGSAFGSIADLLKSQRPVVWGGTGKSDGNSDFAAILAFATGMKAKIVLGYKGTAPINLSMESGETDARVNTDESAAMSARAGKLRVIASLSRQRTAQFPGVPTVFEQASVGSEGARMLDWRAGAAALGRVIITTPGVPKDSLTALRAAFKDVLADPEITADIKKRSLTPGWLSGADVERMVANAMTALDEKTLTLVREVITDRYY